MAPVLVKPMQKLKGANKVFPESGLAFISVKESDKNIYQLDPMLVEHGFSLIATKGTANSISTWV